VPKGRGRRGAGDPHAPNERAGIARELPATDGHGPAISIGGIVLESQPGERAHGILVQQHRPPGIVRSAPFEGDASDGQGRVAAHVEVARMVGRDQHNLPEVNTQGTLSMSGR
jgi:hypothetical protein